MAVAAMTSAAHQCSATSGVQAAVAARPHLGELIWSRGLPLLCFSAEAWS